MDKTIPGESTIYLGLPVNGERPPNLQRRHGGVVAADRLTSGSRALVTLFALGWPTKSRALCYVRTPELYFAPRIT